MTSCHIVNVQYVSEENTASDFWGKTMSNKQPITKHAASRTSHSWFVPVGSYKVFFR
jgi:hypothetical protein